MTQNKKDIIAKFQTHGKDTGSPQVQVAIITDRILTLTEHLKLNKKDKHSRKGLIGLVGKRRKLLAYLKGQDAGAYKETISALGLRH